METNNSSWVMPVMISGMTNGAFTMPVEQQPTAEAREAHQRDRRQRAQHHREGGGRDGDFQ